MTSVLSNVISVTVALREELTLHLHLSAQICTCTHPLYAYEFHIFQVKTNHKFLWIGSKGRWCQNIFTDLRKQFNPLY